MSDRRVSIQQGAGEPFEVELWDHVFTVRDVTRSLKRKATEMWERVDGTEDEDKQVELIGQLLDIRLVPADGKRTKASTLIVRKWQADELTQRQLDLFLDELGEADRPT